MKKQIIFLLIILILSLTVNTSYLWEENSGFFALVWKVFLMISLFFIGLILLINIGKIIFEKKFELEIILLNFLNIVLFTFLFFYPNEIMKSKEKREIFLEAFEEGTVCTTSLKLFKNNEFKELNICFGKTKAEGTYQIKNDTIYFYTEIFPKNSYRYFEFAITKKDEKHFDIIRFYDKNSMGRILTIKQQ